MKNSRILRTICYLLIPILALILVVSLFYEVKVKAHDDLNINSNDYFTSDQFLAAYMTTIAGESRDLIYYNHQYNTTVFDGEYKICYEKDQYINNIDHFYFLILYKNLAITNVELTINTNSIEKIKNYINEINGKKASIINGSVTSDSELIKTKALQYFDRFEFNYYSVNKEDTVVNYRSNSELIIEETPSVSISPIREYFSTNINDFEIYSSYNENLVNSRYDEFSNNLFKELESYEYIMITAIPICSIILILLVVFLIISIGHTKNKDEIDINDFDKLPLEIIGVIFACIIGVFIIVVDRITINMYSMTNLWIAAALTFYLILYTLCMIIFVTAVKRIKAKVFWKTTITGKLFFVSLGIIKKIANKLIKAFNKLNKSIQRVFFSLDSTIRIITIFLIIVLGSIFLLIAFGPFGLFIDCFIAFGVLYYITELRSEYNLIEDHLKKLYNGEEVDKLDERDFSKIYRNSIAYINNIQNGYKDAIEEGIKSERLKTELITNVSHDIKTPLTSIINYVDLLKKEDIKSKKAKEYIDVLDGKSQRLKKLTEDLVEASKASSGNVKLNIEKINLVELIKQLTGEYEDKFKEKKLEVDLSLPKEDIYINADSRYMYRIIENLYSNISKYALKSSRVYIEVINKETKVKATLKNISKEKLNISAEELMQRFVRGDKSRTTEGSGLGLSITQSLTELQDGTFTLSVDGDLFKVELEFNIA